jgi:hypothetical protein
MKYKHLRIIPQTMDYDNRLSLLLVGRHVKNQPTNDTLKYHTDTGPKFDYLKHQIRSKDLMNFFLKS